MVTEHALACDRLPGNKEALDAVAAIAAEPHRDITDQFHTYVVKGDQARAEPAQVQQAIRALINRVRLSPALDWSEKAAHREALTALLADPPARSVAQIQAWRYLTQHLAEAIPTLDREPVRLPRMDDPQEAAWQVLMDFDQDLAEPWVLVGGQMTMIHCLENGLDTYRATDDGDVVLGVWTRRDALTTATRLLQERDFTPTSTADGFGYRYTRDQTTLDLLLPEGLERQRQQPMTATGKPGLSIDGGNQALIRAQRLPVRLHGRDGYIRRPNVLGALVVKAAALRADNRNPNRHREDIALLGQVALQTGLRQLDDRATSHDRKRLRHALASMPATHPAWRFASEPEAVIEGLTRLAQANGRPSGGTD